MNTISCLETYLEEIKKYPLLTFEEEIDLSKKIQNGDEAAKLKLTQSNLRLVVSVATKYAKTETLLLDLIQEGNVGLISAASKYHFSHNVRFSTYAYWWIVQSISRYIDTKKGIISIPSRKKALLRQVEQTKLYLSEKLKREPSLKELSVYMNVPSKTLQKVMDFNYNVSSLDCAIDADKTSTLADVLPSSSFIPEKNFFREDMKESLLKLVQKLPAIERDVILYRYNLNHDLKSKTLCECGNLLGFTAETIRKIELKAMRHLKKVCIESGLSIENL